MIHHSGVLSGVLARRTHAESPTNETAFFFSFCFSQCLPFTSTLALRPLERPACTKHSTTRVMSWCKNRIEVMFIILLIIVFVLNGPPETLGKCILPLFIKIVLLFGEYNLRLFQDVAPGATKLSTFLFTNCAPTFLLTARRLGLFFPPGAQKQSNLR